MLKDRLEEIIRQAQAALTELPVTEDNYRTVTTSEELRLALANGGRIQLVPNTVYGGNFVITVPTMLDLNGATLSPEDRFRETLAVMASDSRVASGIITNGAPDRECVLVGSHTEVDPARQPNRVGFEDVTLRAAPEGGRRGFSLHGSNIEILSCAVRGFYYQGRDAQAVWINNGTGPYLIEDNYLEGSGENIMVGGDRAAIGRNPADVTIRNNTLFKPQEWRQKRGSVKNLLELKAGERVFIEGNILDGCWIDAQIGSAIVITPRNQYGDNPFAKVNDVVIRQNIIRNCPDGFGITMLGRDDINTSEPIENMLVERNLFIDTPYGMQIGNAAALNLAVRRNTFLGIRRHFLSFYGPPLSFFEYTNNVTRAGLYGARRDDAGIGTPSLLGSATSLDFRYNVIEQPAEYDIRFPAENNLVLNGQLDGMLEDMHLLGGAAGW